MEKQRQKTNGAKPQPRAVEAAPQPSPEAPATATSRANEYVNGLLAGDIKPPNRFVADLVAQMREATARLANTRAAVERLEKGLEEARANRIGLDAIVQNIGATLASWQDDATKNGRKGN